ncbi:uncharacterized protein EV420DRAFT_1482117 [Desarmillaria tabescens]|uniref:F-box domain-containing protein n=1 Tax=Armillaria tabescens TaxID=1929756 RepID=A0AA39N0F4_ARMTA|nr:uncharacterized protein EV420DRAFT_1482117 [Desarmillaria tabescens]KAK0452824.1 hypothetical protein EV420DRAFT_1482117 [Desarmillaria tabescens]
MTPTLSMLLGTNDCPSSHQYGALLTSKGKVEDALHEIDMIMTHLEHGRRQLQDIHQSHRSVMSPIRRLPVEILARIFALSTCSFYDVFDPHLKDGPWTLSKVCSGWRVVATRCCPKMWKNMNIACKVAPRDPEALLRLVFSQCRDDPLHIRIGEIGEALIALLPIIMEESRRWRTFEVSYPNPKLVDVLQTVQGKLDILESLRLHMPNDAGQTLTRTFEVAPKLTRVELMNRKGEMQISLPFSQLLTYIDDSYPRVAGMSSAEYFLNILKKSPRLFKFHAGRYLWFLGQHTIVHPAVVPPIVHESLEELSSYDPALLRSVLLPKLKVLKMETPDGKYSLRTPLLALCELIINSNCSLTSLTLRNVALGGWKDVLVLTPCLTTLEVVMRHAFGAYTAGFLSGLVGGLAERGKDPEDSSQYVIVPLLNNLTIEVADTSGDSIIYYGFFNRDFVDMVASRYHSAALQHIRVVAQSNGPNEGIDFWRFGSDEFRWMEKLRSDGLKISVFEEIGQGREPIKHLVTEE